MSRKECCCMKGSVAWGDPCERCPDQRSGIGLTVWVVVHLELLFTFVNSHVIDFKKIQSQHKIVTKKKRVF